MWHHWHYHRPSRLVWFAIGAVSATWFIKSKEADSFYVKHCARHRIPQEAYPAPSAQEQQRKWESRWGWSHPAAGAATGAATGAAAAPAQPPAVTDTTAPPLPMPQSAGADNWEEEKQRLQTLSQQATETLTDLSEAGLDSLMSTVESLKARIAERRALRNKEAKEAQDAQAAREAKFKQFEEWQKKQEEAEKSKPRHIV